MSATELAELFERAHTNTHGITDFEGKALGCGLYPEACFFNHSCAPNSIVSFDGNKMIVHLISSVAEGEEISRQED